MSDKKSKQKYQYTDLLAPITDEQPCGDNLEYDPEFLLLLSKSTEQPETQYGDFVNKPEGVNWNEVERDALRLLVRTKDIRVYILLLRSKIQLSGAAGLLEGLDLLEQACSTYPQNIYPQIEIDENGDEEDAALVRSNALAALTDPEGVMADIRSIILSSNAALRLQIRDVERSLSIPRPADALAPDSVRRQLMDLRLRNTPALTALDKTIPILEKLQIWVSETLKNAAPDLSPLKKLLSCLQDNDNRSASKRECIEENNTQPDTSTITDESPVVQTAEPSAVFQDEALINETQEFLPVIITNRFDALQHIEDIRNWFEAHEPSSPTIPLLRQAERMVGKRFSEVVNSIPLELLQKWDDSET
ncbi:MAG: type VI secretion system ImpA family N-terminal domain-containing protein [Snodgrassella sp.]|uniref:type VI secretion system protein TssA n=1 Tax=Snodgrassella TaxID=1193515 RepID=UPI001EF3D82B|nr:MULTISPECIES: type VI secretion system ImpA family N-terminal domain-containing protein [Snodgrassella]MCO6514382.1 type VI secretion system ImpA family N-terminal domain-containing protein [Snodgrassella sp.]MCO6520975.1 type VI secretion system ImpA family N-terminal domain-containing protein [Snodgrassella sp.]